MLKDWQTWCRLCAKYDGSDIDLFIKFDTVSNLIQIIEKYFNLSITVSDDRPRKICENCFNFLIKLSNFGEHCAKIDTMFSEFLYRQTNPELTESEIQGIRQKYNLEDDKFIINDNPINKTEEFKDQTDSDGNNIKDQELEMIKIKKLKNSKIIKKRKERKNSLNIFQPVICDICQKDFARKSSLVLHKKRVHESNDVVYSCQKCPKQFSTKKDAKRHEIVHLPPELKLIYPCTYCDKRFSNASNMQLHIRAIHHREKPFICEECGKSFCTTAALKEHQVVHSDEKPFACHYCPKKFKNLPKLKIHEEVHSDTKYTCKECGLQLNTRQTLRRHMVVHSDVKTYKCQYCGNEYKRSKTLKDHLILHTGLKPYVCPFCDKTFANGSNCRSHKKKAHPEELASAEAAGYTSHVKNIPKLEQLQPKYFLQNNSFNVKESNSL